MEIRKPTRAELAAAFVQVGIDITRTPLEDGLERLIEAGFLRRAVVDDQEIFVWTGQQLH